MAEYLVKWEIHIDADSKQEAAHKALQIMLNLNNEENTATVFEVDGEEFDLQNYKNQLIKKSMEKLPIVNPVKPGDTITVRGKEWASNIMYFSAKGYINDVQVVEIPFENGYNDHYLNRVFEEMNKLSLLPGVAHYPNGAIELPWKYCKRNNITLVKSVIEVKTRKEL